jgi:prepilin signal peptidase PulO-like enzyme (type II secretory pathway)
VTAVETAVPAPARGREVPGGQTAVLLSASAVSLLCLLHEGLTGRGFLEGFVAFVLVQLSAIDIRSRVLPNRIVLPATVVTLAAQSLLAPDRMLEWPALMIGLVAAGAFAAVLVLLQGRVALRSTMPLGPFLALGGIVELLLR